MNRAKIASPFLLIGDVNDFVERIIPKKDKTKQINNTSIIMTIDENNNKQMQINPRKIEKVASLDFFEIMEFIFFNLMHLLLHLFLIVILH